MTPRHLRLNPPQQRRGISCHAGAGRKDSRIVSGHLVDDGQSGVDAGAVLCIDVPVDDGGEDDARRLLQCDEGAAPGGCVGRAVRATDRNQPTRSEEHTSELQSLMRISYAVSCLKKKKTTT